MHSPRRQPVWLFSMDSENFHAAPTTTAALQAYHQRYGANQAIDFELVHFRGNSEIAPWLSRWCASGLDNANEALASGLTPIVAFSFYTWNAAEFLDLIGELKQACPQLLCIAGGPHVQQAEDYLGQDPIDLIVLGEGEATFQALLDNPGREHWPAIDGLAWLEQGEIRTSAPRQRFKDLNVLPSPLDVLPLTDTAGNALYDAISYETSRGCPFTCAFCEWGTGALGTKMNQFSMERIERDWRHIAASGIKDIWLADSNFGALREDVAKARLVCELKRDTGFPQTFATSWSKKHSPKVQEIVTLLHANDLLPHYQLALQTLTPEALRLSNRQNMAANKYQPIAKDMAEKGIPIAAELIWGLPGDTLPAFEHNLDELLTQFPNVNIFGYTLLPGTEFYRRREEYRIETVPVAGYGKAKGEYVIACHSFDREQGLAGYRMITAHILFVHGHLLPLTTRYLALSGLAPVSPTLRRLLEHLLHHYADALPGSLNIDDTIAVYENRAELYLALLADAEQTYDYLLAELEQMLRERRAAEADIAQLRQLVALDRALAPRTGQPSAFSRWFEFSADRAYDALQRMELPDWPRCTEPVSLHIDSPGGVGEILKDPDGGSWLKAEFQSLRPVSDALEIIELSA